MREASASTGSRAIAACGVAGLRRSFRLASPRASSSASEDEGVASAAGVGLLELRLHAALPFGARGVHLHRQAGGAQRLARHHRDGQRFGTGNDRIDVDRLGRHRNAGRLEQQQHAFDPHAPADRGRALAAELLEHAVVAAAAADGALRAEAIGHPLEDGQVVVVETAHQSRIDAIAEPGGIEHGADGGEMAERLGAEEVHQPRRAVGDRLHRRVLAVEDAQRIAVQAAPRILVERIGVLLQVRDQPGAMRAALVGLAEAVDLEANVVADDETEVLEQRAAHQDLLGVDIGPGVAEGFDVDLVELAIAALLRPLVPEHHDLAPQAQRSVVERVVLDHGAHDPRGRLRAERQPIAVHRVLEGVHLLLDDVGHLAEAAHEERRRLDDRRAHVDVGVAAHQRAHLVLEPLPARRFRRQDVVHALDGAQAFGQWNPPRLWLRPCAAPRGGARRLGAARRRRGAHLQAPNRFSM